jgi:hypothetical protein
VSLGCLFLSKRQTTCEKFYTLFGSNGHLKWALKNENQWSIFVTIIPSDEVITLKILPF